MINYPNFPNKAHQRAYENGSDAASAGKDRVPPYGYENLSSLHFRRAWLSGYDGRRDAMDTARTVSRGDA